MISNMLSLFTYKSSLLFQYPFKRLCLWLWGGWGGVVCQRWGVKMVIMQAEEIMRVKEQLNQFNFCQNNNYNHLQLQLFICGMALFWDLPALPQADMQWPSQKGQQQKNPWSTENININRTHDSDLVRHHLKRKKGKELDKQLDRWIYRCAIGEQEPRLSEKKTSVYDLKKRRFYNSFICSCQWPWYADRYWLCHWWWKK